MTSTSCPPRNVVISGASTGIGRATALRLADDGWHVLAGVRRLEDAPPTPAGASGWIRALQLDVTDSDSVASAREHVEGLLAKSPLTALVNNAGIGMVAPMQTVELSALQEVWEVNVAGVVRLSQALIPLMAAGSRLLVLGSIGDRLTVPYGGPLTSSKWAVASVAEAFRLELACQGIAVTIVEPGSIHSEAVTKVEAAAAATTQIISQTDPGLADRFRRAVEVAVANERSGSDPAVVAAAISRTLDADRPRTRILVGKHARLMAIAAVVLPDRILDRVRLRLFRQPSLRLADVAVGGQCRRCVPLAQPGERPPHQCRQVGRLSGRGHRVARGENEMPGLALNRRVGDTARGPGGPDECEVDV